MKCRLFTGIIPKRKCKMNKIINMLDVILMPLLFFILFLTGASNIKESSEDTQRVSAANLLIDKAPIPSVLFNGKDWPIIKPFYPEISKQKNILYVSPTTANNGDGSENNPWNDLQSALCKLNPGDRLILMPGTYSGRFDISEENGCQDGAEQYPIQLVGSQGAVIDGGLRLRRSFWQFVQVEITSANDPKIFAFLIQGQSNVEGILLDQMNIHHGARGGIRVERGSKNVTISNSHIYNFRKIESGELDDAHGIDVMADGKGQHKGAMNILIKNNHIHHNSGDSIQIWGPGDGSIDPINYASHIHIIGNIMHNDRENAVDVKDARKVVIKENKMWGYQPSQTSSGYAVVIHYDADDVVIEDNFIANSFGGVEVERGTVTKTNGEYPADGKPDEVLIVKNYIKGDKRSQLGLSINDANCVKIYNNIFNYWRGGLAVYGDSTNNQNFYVANNIFMENSNLAFYTTFDFEDIFKLFDYNAFVNSGRPIMAQIGGKIGEDRRIFNLLDHTGKGKNFPHSIVSKKIEFRNNDLAKMYGFETVDKGIMAPAGTACDDSEQIFNSKGKAPDIGIYEQD